MPSKDGSDEAEEFYLKDSDKEIDTTKSPMELRKEDAV
jgi:hypothetical protein